MNQVIFCAKLAKISRSESLQYIPYTNISNRGVRSSEMSYSYSEHKNWQYTR